ncbi:unnamed protein product [Microthlaspi erraticum]|uniref:CCHC-type domain-containing protein n=1 Tax=Microthlaspi erraticum TaxID=1685480 RepID=A0A6D2HK10_9BRAS|nr:unnamed protein product [Microthlaspi erraticum]
MIARIPNDYLRSKILEKGVWYVGDSMFHTAKWTAGHSSDDKPLVTLQLWAHLTGVPLDLRHQRGMRLIAGLVGEPKETDDFTKNLVSLTLSHVKVEVNMSKEFPNVVEYERDSGEVVEVRVDYPWLPPKCSHCQELGHIAKNCLLLSIPSKVQPPAAAKEQVKKVYQKKKDTISVSPNSEGIGTLQAPPLINKKVIPPLVPQDSSLPDPLAAPSQELDPILSALNTNPSLAALSANKLSPTTKKSTSLPSSPKKSHVPSIIIALPATFTATGEPYPYSPPLPPLPQKKASLKRSRSNPSLFSPFTLKVSSVSQIQGPPQIPLKNAFSSLTNSVTSFEDPPPVEVSCPSS